MPIHRHSPLLRVLGLLLVVALIAASCGGSDDDDSTIDTAGDDASSQPADDDPTDDDGADGDDDASIPPPDDPEPIADRDGDNDNDDNTDADNTDADDPEPSEEEVFYLSELCPRLEAGDTEGIPASVLRAAEICEAVDSEGQDEIALKSCAGGDFMPTLLHNGEQGEEFMASGHMMVRLHPVDEFEGQNGFNPVDEIGPLTPADGTLVIVIDSSGHGHHAAGLAAQLLDSEYEYVPYDAIVGQSPWEPPTRTEIDGLARDRVIYIDIPSEGIEPYLLIPESVIVTVLDSLASLFGALGAEQPDLIVNMSFGGYNCGQAPERLASSLTEMAGSGILFTASAGNDEHTGQLWPSEFSATVPGVYTIGSIDPDVSGAIRSCFSNSRNVTWWVHGEEVFAESTSGTWSGTSFAAPQVAAMLAADPTGQTLDLGAGSTQNDPNAVTTVYRMIDPSGDPVLDAGGDEIHVQTTCDPGGQYVPNPDLWEAK